MTKTHRNLSIRPGLRTGGALAAVSLFAAVPAQAQDGERAEVGWRAFDPPPATVLAPEEALETFRLPPGFRIELVAAEPLVEDPVAAAWDADGRLWVAEMRAYMHDAEGTGENQGIDRVVVLEDVNGDGRMDRSTVFLDGLVMPRSITHVEGGVLIAEPPRLWFCQDTTGDLVCDRKVEISDSYGQRDAASRTASGLVRAVDNWIYSSRHPERFRFRDGRLVSEPDGYRGDFGVSQDDYGRIYANTNSSWLHADLVPPAYLLRHPDLRNPAGIYERLVRDQSVHSARVNTGVNQGHVPGVLRPDGRLAETTSATWPHVYRGDQFPEVFRGNAFVPEPAGNVVARFSLEREGVRPAAAKELTPDPDWDLRDFLSSTDERFRPVQCLTGPDGCLYVVDFHRGIIEYKLFVTPFLAEQIEERGLARPLGLGRIYRVVHESGERRPAPPLSKAPVAELVDLLSHPNGWRRDTAQRLLVERGDDAALEPLRATARDGASAPGRLHALWTLEGMGEADAGTVLAAMRDEHPRVRAAAIRIGDSLPAAPAYLAELLEASQAPEPEVRLQALLSLGEFSGRPEARRAMMELGVPEEEAALFRDAAVSGLAGREIAFLRELLESPEAGSRTDWVRDLAMAVFRGRRPERIEDLLALAAGEGAAAPARLALLDGMARAFREPRPVMLSREPEALAALREVADGRLRERLGRVEETLAWPGKPAEAAAPEPVRPLTAAERERFERGREIYRETCLACHQIHGRGMRGLAPPLVGSRRVLEDEEALARIVLHGMSGPLTDADGEEWNLVMPGLGSNPQMTDESIAAVLSYVRREWEHAAEPVEPGTVSRVREAGRGRVLPWTAEELGD